MSKLEELFNIAMPTSYLTPLECFALVGIFFLTSIVGVVTGSTSLITVPVMLLFGVEPRSAVATNMLALVFMSAGGTLSFRGRNTIDRHRAPLLAILALAGSLLGALTLLLIPSRALPGVISVLVIIVALFSLFKPDAGITPPEKRHISLVMYLAGYLVTFILSIYGGFFSGGYVTLLTAAFVWFFGMTFIQAVSTTKLVNIVSSLSATIVFMHKGLVDYRLGTLLGLAMFIGAFIGGRLTLKIGNLWLRRIFMTAVIALVLKIAIHDLLLKMLAEK